MSQKIAIIGLGYVGLPLAHAFSEKYEVIGFDIAQWRIDELNSGIDRTLELNETQVKEALANGMQFTNVLENIADCNVYIVTVPTPIDEHKRPDLTPLIKASESIGKVLKKDDIVIYESTVYPGATEEDCVPVLEKFSGLKFNEDFFCGYPPQSVSIQATKNILSQRFSKSLPALLWKSAKRWMNSMPVSLQPEPTWHRVSKLQKRQR